MEKLRKNKKMVIAVAIIAILAIAGGSYVLANNSKSESKDGKAFTETNLKKKTEKSDNKKDENDSDSKSNKDAADKKDTKTDDKASDEVFDDSKKTALKQSTVSSGASNSGSSSVSQGSSSNSSSAVSSGSSASKPKRWVVDKDAWDEPVTQPVYVDAWWVKFTDGTTKTYYDEMEAYTLYRDRPDIVAAWGNSGKVLDPSGATEVVGYIHHDEVGHWE